MKGLVCRNPNCTDFRHPYLIPRANRYQLAKLCEAATMKDKVIKQPEKCCPKALFNIKLFFESMKYVGSVQSRANEYFCYRHENMNLISTGLKELTRFNAVHHDDLAEIESMVNGYMGNESFSATDLRSNCLKFSFDSKRITSLQYLVQQGKDEFNELYWMMLFSCYVLAAEGRLTLEKHGRGIEFVKNPRVIKKSRSASIFKDVRYLYNINENTAVFNSGPFYLEVRCNGYRGSIVPYTKEEIDYLSGLVDSIPSRKRLDIPELMYSMDYSHRFLHLYDLLGFRNIRNEREETDFFERRIKSGLELVAKIYQNIRVDKEGRKKVFIKT